VVEKASTGGQVHRILIEESPGPQVTSNGNRKKRKKRKGRRGAGDNKQTSPKRDAEGGKNRWERKTVRRGGKNKRKRGRRPDHTMAQEKGSELHSPGGGGEKPQKKRGKWGQKNGKGGEKKREGERGVKGESKSGEGRSFGRGGQQPKKIQSITWTAAGSLQKEMAGSGQEESGAYKKTKKATGGKGGGRKAKTRGYGRKKKTEKLDLDRGGDGGSGGIMRC